MSKSKISLIAALSENRVIGKDNKLPWHIAEDLKRFKQLTLHHPVIMGRKTFESIGRLLPQRMNIIISRDQSYRVEGATVAHSLEEAIAIASQHDRTEIFIIGGGQIFTQALSIADRLYMTLVHTTIEGDAYFPDYKDFTKVVAQEDGVSGNYSYTFLTLERS